MFICPFQCYRLGAERGRCMLGPHSFTELSSSCFFYAIGRKSRRGWSKRINLACPSNFFKLPPEDFLYHPLCIILPPLTACKTLVTAHLWLLRSLWNVWLGLAKLRGARLSSGSRTQQYFACQCQSQWDRSPAVSEQPLTVLLLTIQKQAFPKKDRSDNMPVSVS